MTRHRVIILENKTSSTKPEVHNVSQRRYGRTKPWPQAISIKMVKFSRVIFECEQTDKQTRQTDRQTGIPIRTLYPSWGELKIDVGSTAGAMICFTLSQTASA